MMPEEQPAILYHFRTRGSGAEAVHISGMAEAFERKGSRILFSSPTGIDPRNHKGSNPFASSGDKKSLVARLSDKLPDCCFEFLELAYNFYAYFRNLEITRKNRIAFIYERHAFFLFSTAILASLRNIPLIVEVNELIGDERIRRQPLMKAVAEWTDRVVFSKAALIVVVSPHLRRRIISSGIPEQRVLVLPNAIHPEEFVPDLPPDKVRRSLGLKPSDLVIAFVGWFVPWHRLDWTMECFASMTSDHPKARLVLFGDGDLKDQLVSKARQLGIQEKVLFPGPIDHEQIPNHLNAADVCLIPHSNAFRSPIKLFEYMALGKAIVAPATEPISAVVSDEQEALLFPMGSKDGFMKALDRLLSSESLRAELGGRARSHVLTHHTWDQNAQQVLQGLEGH